MKLEELLGALGEADRPRFADQIRRIVADRDTLRLQLEQEAGVHAQAEAAWNRERLELVAQLAEARAVVDRIETRVREIAERLSP